MKNKVVFALVAVAIPLYIWDSHILVSGIFGTKTPASRQTLNAPLKEPFSFFVPAPRFQNKGRSPFIAYKEKPKPVEIAVVTKKTAAPKPIATPPKITITGIMWHPTNPIAMITLPDGSSSAVRTGQAVGNLKVKTIEKSRMLVSAEGTEFWIAK